MRIACIGHIDGGVQRHCGTDSVPVIMTTAAQSTTNRELPEALVSSPREDISEILGDKLVALPKGVRGFRGHHA